MRQNKYLNKKTVVDGITFDSRKEAKYYIYLKQLERDGKIENLQMQVPYELIPAVYEDTVVHLKTKDKVVRKCIQRAVHYYADFVYLDKETNEIRVIDAKGFRTKEFILKSKMMLAFKGIKIKEV